MIELFGFNLELWQLAAGAFGVLFAAMLGVIALSWLRNKLVEQVQGYPREAEIEAVLVPLLDQAIIHAYKASEAVADEIGQRLRGADKAAIAAGVYDMLPDTIRAFGKVFHWKHLILRERFVQQLGTRFGEAVALFDEASGNILDYIKPETYGMEPDPEQPLSDATRPKSA